MRVLLALTIAMGIHAVDYNSCTIASDCTLNEYCPAGGGFCVDKVAAGGFCVGTTMPCASGLTCQSYTCAAPPTNAAPAPTNAAPAPTNAAPTNAAPTNAAPTNAAPTNAAPTNAAAPTNSLPAGACVSQDDCPQTEYCQSGGGFCQPRMTETSPFCYDPVMPCLPTLMCESYKCVPLPADPKLVAQTQVTASEPLSNKQQEDARVAFCITTATLAEVSVESFICTISLSSSTARAATSNYDLKASLVPVATLTVEAIVAATDKVNANTAAITSVVVAAIGGTATPTVVTVDVTQSPTTASPTAKTASPTKTPTASTKSPVTKTPTLSKTKNPTATTKSPVTTSPTRVPTSAPTAKTTSPTLVPTRAPTPPTFSAAQANTVCAACISAGRTWDVNDGICVAVGGTCSKATDVNAANRYCLTDTNRCCLGCIGVRSSFDTVTGLCSEDGCPSAESKAAGTCMAGGILTNQLTWVEGLTCTNKCISNDGNSYNAAGSTDGQNGVCPETPATTWN